MASATGSADVTVSVAPLPRPPIKRFTLFDVSGRGGGGSLVLDPWAVASVVEEDRRSDRGYVQIAVIRLSDGMEYVVNDYSRTVAADIWAGKSVIIP
jgi:hypothetical protein